MKDDLLKILQIIKEDFKMLQDGSWELNHLHSNREIEASISNVEKAIKIAKNNADLTKKYLLLLDYVDDRAVEGCEKAKKVITEINK